MMEDNSFIIEPEKIPKRKNAFPVVFQISIVLVILGGIFMSIIIPKTLAILDKNNYIAGAGGERVLNDNNQTEKTAENLVFHQDLSAFENLSLFADIVLVYDTKEEQILFEKNTEKVWPLASITKLMTALVAYELVEDDTVAKISATSTYLETAGTLKAGESYKVRELADFMLISSYNGSAYVLAETVGEKLGDKDSVSQFVAAMNVRAEELGLKSLKFYNPTGLDIDVAKGEAGAVGNAHDIAKMTEYILKNYPAILAPTTKATTRLYNQEGGYHAANNTNPNLLSTPNILGSKTGYTDLADGNLVVAFDALPNHPVIVVVLNSSYDGRFIDVDNLIKATKTALSDSELNVKEERGLES